MGNVLFLFTLGLKAQKHLARGQSGQRRPELMCQIIFALQGQKRRSGKFSTDILHNSQAVIVQG